MQTIISLLKKRSEVTVKMYEKVEIMFKTHFLFLSMIFTNNIRKFFYSSSVSDEKTITNQKLKKVVYKIDINKILKVNKVIN